MEISYESSNRISEFNDSEDSDGPKNNILSYFKNDMKNKEVEDKDLQLNIFNKNKRNELPKNNNDNRNELEKDNKSNYHKSTSSIKNSNDDKSNISYISNIGDFEVEIHLNNGIKEKIKLNLDDDINYKIELLCKQKKYGIKEKDEILRQLNQKINNLINYYENQAKTDNYTLIMPIKKNKYCVTHGDILGQRLYEKCLREKIIKKKKIEEMKKLNNSEISSELTFHPKISKKSKEMNKYLNKNIKIEDRLIALGKEREKRILKKVAINSFIENNDIDNDDNNNELTYKPKINKYTLTRNKSEDIFSKLYKTANIYKIKAQKTNELYFKEKCPFKPKISKMSKNMNDSEYNKVIKRFYDKEQQKRIKILKEHTPETKKIRRKKNVYNNIYKVNKKKVEDNKNNDEEKNRQIELKKINEKRQEKWIEYSNDIIKQTKEIKFKEIFDLLDRNKKKFISYSNISYYDIPDEIMPALTPVIEEVNRNKNKKINYEEFKKLAGDSLNLYMMKMKK